MNARANGGGTTIIRKSGQMLHKSINSDGFPCGRFGFRGEFSSLLLAFIVAHLMDCRMHAADRNGSIRPPLSWRYS